MTQKQRKPQPKKQPPSSSGGNILFDLLRVIGVALYGVAMSLALAFIPVMLLTADFSAPPTANSGEQPAGQPVAQGGTPTPHPTCDGAQAWWNENQNLYNDFAASMSELFSGAYNSSSVVQALQSERDTFSRAAYPDCLAAARGEFLAGMDDTIAAFGIANPDDAELRFMQGKDRFAAGINILWEFDISTDATSAPALDTPQGGGANCNAVAWYGGSTPARNNYLNTVFDFDPTLSIEQFERFIDDLQDLRDAYAVLDYPPCATAARQHFLNLMNAFISALENSREGEIDAMFADFERISYEIQFYTNWKRWLGIEAAAAEY